MPFEDNTAFGCSLGTTESADTVVVVGIFGRRFRKTVKHIFKI
jgi:hypothetical protein